MMEKVAFEQSIEQAKSLLKEMQLFRREGIKVTYRDGISNEFKTASIGSSYFNAYKVGLINFDYDIILQDNSFFQFSHDVVSGQTLPNLRYAFFQNPQEYVSYEGYLDELRSQGYIQDETNDDLGDSFYEEYEQSLLERQLNSASTTMRYDLDEAGYRSLVHAVSHIHIGHQNNVRIPCNKILTPLNFILFVIKHVYYYEWKWLIEGENRAVFNELANSKKSCPAIAHDLWTEIEQLELFIT